MTFTQIEKVKYFLSQSEKANSLEEIKILGKELQAFWGEKFNIKLYVNSFYEEYPDQKLRSDKASIHSFLEGILSENDINNVVFGILGLIDEGNNFKGNNKQMTDFVSKVYFSYNDKIKFDKTTESAVSESLEAFNMIGAIQVDENMVNGIINKLRNYGMTVLSQPASTNTKPNPSVVINNNNTNTATASANTDIKITIEQAKQQVEDAGFSDQQYKDVMDKLAEIESIGKSTDTKGSKWKKAKEILKWCAEQGIEIAKIVLPLLPQMLDK